MIVFRIAASLLLMAPPYALAESVFTNMSVTEPIEVQESVSETDHTMSGSQKLAIRTNNLFAAFQFISDHQPDETSAQPKINISDIRHAPITVPSAAADRSLKLCTEIKTINGFYEALGSSEDLQAGVDFNLASLVKAQKSALIDGNYTESLMLLRGFVAPDCDAGRSSYYVPMYFEYSKENRTKPDTFLAVFEIGNARVQATLHAVSSAGQTDDAPLLEFTCVPTTRVDRGHDCTIPLRSGDLTWHSLYEVRLVVVRPHQPEPQSFRARVTIPQHLVSDVGQQ